MGDLVRADSAQSAVGAAEIKGHSVYLNIISLVIGIILLVFFALVIRDQQGQLKSIIENLISEITTAVKEQSKGISEVSKAMGLLDQSSSQNSVISKENLESSKELQDQVQKLEAVIKSLSEMMTSNKAVQG